MTSVSCFGFGEGSEKVISGGHSKHARTSYAPTHTGAQVHTMSSNQNSSQWAERMKSAKAEIASIDSIELEEAATREALEQMLNQSEAEKHEMRIKILFLYKQIENYEALVKDLRSGKEEKPQKVASTENFLSNMVFSVYFFVAGLMIGVGSSAS